MFQIAFVFGGTLLLVVLWPVLKALGCLARYAWALLNT